MAVDHPFQHLFESVGRLPSAHAEVVNHEAFVSLHEALDVALAHAGRCIMLRAPRAGHGKTHLLCRTQHHLRETHEFVPIHASFGSRIDAGSVIADTLRVLTRPLPASGGLCQLDLVVRRLFAEGLQPLVSSGEVPCQDRDAALAALRSRPIETFDFHHPGAVTAQWARENFEVLGQRMASELANRAGLATREIGFWVDLFFRFAATPLENTQRLRGLGESALAGSSGQGDMMDRLVALLGLISIGSRVVLVADELEGFSTEEGAALQFAAFVAAVKQAAVRVDWIISLNQDVWENAFLPKLSGGLADRLSEVVVELRPLRRDEILALLDCRAPGLAEKILERIDPKELGTHARGVVRAAGLAWVRAAAAKQQSSPSVNVSAPAAAATPVAEVSVSNAPAPSEPVSSEETRSTEAPATNPDGFVPVEDESTELQIPPPVPDGPEPTPAAPDRVDDLLRQFRERYSRGL